MPLVEQKAPPSTLATVIGQVVDAFQEMADATPIMVGERYLEEGVGAAPRVVIVPEAEGSIGAPTEMGYVASIAHGCTVYVRAGESGGDVDRFERAYELGDLVIACFATAAPGRIEWGSYGDGSPVNTDSYGAELVFSFRYRRNVAHSAARRSLAPATADSSTKVPLVPPGQAGTVDSVDITTEPED